MALLSLAAQLCMQETKTPSLDTPDTAGVLEEQTDEPPSAANRNL
jgi:hypothetical protein